jgi:uncharacterized protein (DUF305 family)
VKLSTSSFLLSVTVVALVACGGGEDDAATDASGFNDADVEFAQGMIPHHEQAIAMSEIALDPASGASQEVVDMASQITAAQDPEIELMTGWLAAWEQPVEMDTSDGHDMADMPGMMSAEEMDGLDTMSGADFDSAWLAMMIEHHEGAIEMAEEVQDAGNNADVLALAEEIVTAQRQEIDEMNALLAG